MDKPMILYRGTLKSCNYRCSYCPFSRRPMGKRELEQDRDQWMRFVRVLPDLARSYFSGPAGALMVVPYGEALIHPWYWEGLGLLSASAQMDAVGAQTNLSFQTEPSLALYRKAGGDPAKLRLWASFHPEMVTAEAFAKACRTLLAAGVSLCAGAVGAPWNLEEIRLLRQELPDEIYLWINRMDGMNRDYTREEIADFLEIDPCFRRELVPIPAEPGRCGRRLLADGNGTLRLCNISPAIPGLSWESMAGADGAGQERPELPPLSCLCRQKACSCYLAYGGRDDFMNRILFGPYPLFRIPRRPKAVFLDIQGTLIPQDTVSCRSKNEDSHKMRHGRIPGMPDNPVPALTQAALEALNQDGIPLFFATTLPYDQAMIRCRSIRHLFSGGIFAGGAHIRLEPGAVGNGVLMPENETKELIYVLEESYARRLGTMKVRFRFRILLFRKENQLYKITLLRPRQLPWTNQEITELARVLALSGDPKIRYFAEDCCLQIVPANATKEQGVRVLCRWLGIRPEEAAAAGDSGEDAGMMEVADVPGNRCI